MLRKGRSVRPGPVILLAAAVLACVRPVRAQTPGADTPELLGRGLLDLSAGAVARARVAVP